MAKKSFMELFSDYVPDDYKDYGNHIPQNEPQGNGGFIGNAVNSSVNTNPEKKAETSVEELRNKYSERTRAQYENKAAKLRRERDEALRENWVLQQQAQAALPEQMAAAGLNGGAAETTVAAMNARYQGNRNDIRSGYMDNLGELSEEYAAQQAENERAYNEKWIDYILSLAEMEEEYKNKKALAAIGN